MESKFLGKGWRIPIDHENQKIAMADDYESVRQSIWIILSTVPGERVMRPDFGCGIHELVYALNTSGTVGAVIDAVHNALIRWEPRIDLLDVTADIEPTAPDQLLIEIHYRLRADNSRFNLVYPFYLR
jgi:phage baseplate assembly protein W